jgi:hypothetical protein
MTVMIVNLELLNHFIISFNNFFQSFLVHPLILFLFQYSVTVRFRSNMYYKNVFFIVLYYYLVYYHFIRSQLAERSYHFFIVVIPFEEKQFVFIHGHV